MHVLGEHIPSQFLLFLKKIWILTFLDPINNVHSNVVLDQQAAVIRSREGREV